MGKLKKIWKKIWEPEDDETFGNLCLIVGSVLITKGLDILLSETISWIMYIGIGFLSILYGTKLLRKKKI